MKWFFLIASIISFPIGIIEFSAVEWSQLFISSDFKLAFEIHFKTVLEGINSLIM